MVTSKTSGKLYGVIMKHLDSVLVCGTGGALLKYTAGIVGVKWEHTIVEDYQLLQNYPNPFNPTTTIKFAIPKAGNVTLKVYDIRGREVEAVLNNVPLNAGTMSYEFNGTNLSSGIYFYTLIVDDNMIGTKKMKFIK
jgi:hypothetical protein